ncbi:hypothetical protein [Spirosoma radiotolerans]|uniref:Uncharacterized protein n=1 Tax=Spirosoma radiotolerans TaxID=1379870 RepID=A0A0E3ZVD1_9BACT|nr:hypothetical protein [Spirosoma radiotolerans]AKD55038.1 hypothetical protein SD10_09105 [Spirosoma radiotolerans]
MALTDNDYCQVTLSDGTKRYLPVALGTTCGQRPTIAQAQAALGTMLQEGFVPTDFHLASKGCVLSQIVVQGDNSNYTEDGESLPSGDGFDTSYTFERVGSDFAGHSFVSTPAPILTPVAQAKPRPTGNHYAFAAQTALNTALAKRIPQFAPHSSKILIYPGGLYTLDTDNAFIGRGWTHTSESAQWPNGQAYPAQFKRALEYANYAAAKRAADQLPDGHPSKQKLYDWSTLNPAFEGDHLFIDDEDTCKLYAAQWYIDFLQPDKQGGGVEYFSVNHEIWKIREGSPYDYVAQWYRQVGWITKEIIRLSEVDGKPMKSGMSDFGNLCATGPYFFDDNDSATGYPKYLSYGTINEPYRGNLQNNPLGAPSDLGALVLAGKAFAGVGHYMQHTSDGQSLFEKDGDGALIVSNGGLVYRTDKRAATICGQATVIYKDDNELAMIKRYGYEAANYANWFFRAGSVHLPMSNLRGAGYESVRFIEQFRLDTEAQSGSTLDSTGLNQAEFDMLNSRPLDPEWTEGNAIRMYLNADYMRGWMDSQPRTDLGADNNKQSKARASVEIYAKGFQRAANLNWIFDTPYQLIEPKLWLKNQGLVSARSDDEEFYRKPILRGGHCVKDGRRTIWMRGEWPCQDVDHTTDVLVWVDNGSAVSPSYLIRLDGRKTFLDYWQLPVDFPAFESKHVYFQFQTLRAELVTWRGDYREAKITSNPTPPALTD